MDAVKAEKDAISAGGASQRLSSEERRRQIIEAVFEVMSEHGIADTTMARVAAQAGVGMGTLYRYFDNQRAMLQAAIVTLSARMTAIAYDSYQEDPIEHLREMARRHQAYVSSKDGAVARLWMEFVSANPKAGLRETILETQQRAFEATKEVCVRGVEQGVIREGVDLDLLAYQILDQAWGADMNALMGLEGLLGRNFPAELLDKLIDSIVKK